MEKQTNKIPKKAERKAAVHAKRSTGGVACRVENSGTGPRGERPSSPCRNKKKE